MPSKLIPGEKKTPVYKKPSPTRQFLEPTMGTSAPVDYGQNVGQTMMYKKIQKTGTPLYKMKGHTLPGIKQK